MGAGDIPARSDRDLHLVLDFPETSHLIREEFQTWRKPTDTDLWLMDVSGELIDQSYFVRENFKLNTAITR